MNRTVVAVGSVIVALAVGGFAWRDNQALKATKLELANTGAQLEQARAAYRSMEAAAEGFRQEAVEQKLATDQVHADLNATKAFLEAEKGSSTRLREELTATKAQITSRTGTRAK
jgi:hypothetical protein